MKRRVVPFLVALGLIVLVIAGFFGIRLVERDIHHQRNRPTSASCWV